MNQEPKELTARLAFLQEANEQLKVFHESGRHIPGQIMDVWMDRLSTDSLLLLPEVVASYQEYLQTGKHLTLNELDDWMATWGTDQEQAKPPLHT
jgi:hypothetical protein